VTLQAAPGRAPRLIRTHAAEAHWRLAAWLLLGAVLLLIVSTFRDYGLTWDEAHSATNGRYWVDFYASWFTARGAMQTRAPLTGPRPNPGAHQTSSSNGKST
jgi:hypothetical protein